MSRMRVTSYGENPPSTLMSQPYSLAYRLKLSPRPSETPGWHSTESLHSRSNGVTSSRLNRYGHFCTAQLSRNGHERDPAKRPQRQNAMSQRTRYNRRKYARVDVWGLSDVRRTHGLSFAVAAFLQELLKLANHRDFLVSTSISDLHDLTGLSRKTIPTYVEELVRPGLITTLPVPHGSRGLVIDVSPVYNELIVPNDTTNLGGSGSEVKPKRTLSGSQSRQVAHLSSENSQFGGSEAVREQEEDSLRVSQQLLDDFEDICFRMPETREALTQAIEQFGFDSAKRWHCEVASSGMHVSVRNKFHEIEKRYTF